MKKKKKKNKKSQKIKKENQNQKKYIICKNCECGIYFIINNAISFSCNCCGGSDKSLKYFKKNFVIKESYLIRNKIEIKCKKHGKKYKSFCEDCLENKYVNLCEDCMIEHQNNYKNHKPFLFEDAGDLIKKTKEILNDEDYKKEYSNNFYQQIYELINILIENFEEYPCYNYYASIKDAYKFLCQLKDNKTYIIINSIDNLINFKGNIDSINSFIILGDKNDIGKETLDFEYLSNKKLSNLKNITIKYVNIKNFNSLLNHNLENLETIAFEECKFEEIDKIDYDKLKNCRNLKYLSFYKDGIIDTKLLVLLNNDKLFPNVITLYIGGNLFSEEKLLKLKEKKDFKIHLNKNIEEIGITGNFNKKTNEFIKYFDFNPKILYISRNELDSLKVIENFKFERLEKFWAIENNITDLSELKKYLKSETVRIINLKNNPIKSIDNLEEIIDHFTHLEKLTLTFEDYDEKSYKDIIDRIETKRKKFELEINGIKII